MIDVPTPAGRSTRQLSEPAPCRFCDRPAWIIDDHGPLHPCCAIWSDELQAGRPCPACAASRSHRRTRRH